MYTSSLIAGRIALLIGVWLGIGQTAGAQASVGEPEAVQVDLLPKATASRHQVTVGEVAALHGGPAPLRQWIGTLDIADLPAPGRSTTVRRMQLAFRLQLAGVPTAAVRLAGADECVVKPQRRTVSDEQIIDAARRAHLAQVPWNAEDLAIRLLQPIAVPLPEVAADDEVAIKAQPYQPGYTLGRVRMDVTILVNGEAKLALPVYFDVRLLQTVAVCRRPVAAGEVFSETNIHCVRRPVEPNSRGALSADAVLGRTVRRPLEIGAVVTAGDLDSGRGVAAETLVKSNQPVRMVVRLGSLEVAATGEALQTGRLGEWIHVRNVDSKKVVIGKVTGAALVEVDERKKP